ncbi:unnamed protein product [Enterobius vermicularis]|uniref:DNA polymerase delta subunit 3 n=1 Tax=Enterobius vermicularis TaxID=51028 RepID=A0A0N4VCD5_ENTVE|nr:unnamed protein product [Enterobius vermicularis]
MTLDTRDILETTLLDSRQPVTVTYLSRHAGITVADAHKEIKSYYESQKSTNDLRAVYLISGTLKNVNGEVKKDERPECSHECRRTELVREEKLESKKSTYETVDTCEIYCLHISPIKSLLLLYNIDHLDDAKFMLSDVERSWLKCPQAGISRAALHEKHEESAKLFAKIAEVPMKEGQKRPHSKTPSPKRKRRSEDEHKFADACLRTKISPKKGDGPAQGKKVVHPKGAGSDNQSTQEVKQKQRGRRIVLEDEGDKVKTVSSSVEGKCSMVNAPSTSATKLKRKEGYLSQKDIFSIGASSSDEEVGNEEDFVKEVASRSKKEKSPKFTIEKPKVSTMESVLKSRQKSSVATKKEYVTESFVDEDGFTVTKQVLKEVPVQVVSQEKPLSVPLEKLSNGSNENTKRTVKKPGGKKGHTTQCKISSFFKK